MQSHTTISIHGISACIMLNTNERQCRRLESKRRLWHHKKATDESFRNARSERYCADDEHRARQCAEARARYHRKK